MPICEIIYVNGFLSDKEKEIIVKKLTPILLKAEGLEDNSKSRSICFISLNPSNSIYIGGVHSDEGKVVIKIWVFADAYNDSIKNNLYSEITQLFIDENKYTMEQGGNNIWCIILPIEKNNFGVGGIPVSLEMTKQFVSLAH